MPCPRPFIQPWPDAFAAIRCRLGEELQIRGCDAIVAFPELELFERACLDPASDRAGRKVPAGAILNFGETSASSTELASTASHTNPAGAFGGGGWSG